MNFIFHPSASLLSRQRDAEGVIRQYAVALLCLAAIPFYFVSREHISGSDNDFARFERYLAGILALYHHSPLLRAVCRIIRGEDRLGKVEVESGGKTKTKEKSEPLLKQPRFHVVVHLVCGVALAGKGLD